MILHSAASGQFKVEVLKGNRVDSSTDWQPNLITDIGLLHMGANSNYLNVCRVGSGAAAPTNSDTQLQTQMASSTTYTRTSGAQSATPYYAYERRTFTFATGAVVGNVAELGIGWATSGATLFSRARVRDGNGNPASVPVLADETLRVTYELRYYAPTFDIDTSMYMVGTLGGNYEVKARSSMCSTATFWFANKAQNQGGTLTAYEGEIGDITEQPDGLRATLNIPNGSVDGTSANFSMSAENANLNLANGIRSMSLFMGNAYYQFQFTPAIMKDNESSLRLQFKHTWGRK